MKYSFLLIATLIISTLVSAQQHEIDYTNTRDDAFQLLEHNGVLCTSLECPAGDDCPYQKPENSNIFSRAAAKMQLDKFLNIR